MTDTMLDPEAPIVVGALGGSGTRVLGQLLIELGVHMGGHVNDASDSLTASLLFNRPGDDGDRDVRIARFERIGRLIRGDADLADRAAVIAAVRGIDHPPLRYRMRYALGALKEQGAPAGATGWGFKEPNTHLFLDDLDAAFDRLRFVYVMRHPLDMAFTANLQQLHNWAPHFDIDLPDCPEDIPAAQLDLWLAATRRATTHGPELLGDRFLALDYERLLTHPEAEVAHLSDFVGIESVDLAALVELVRTPSTTGRYRDQDLSQLRSDQLEAIGHFGFSN